MSGAKSPTNLFLVAALLALWASAVLTPSLARAEEPQWIWPTVERRDGQRAALRREFTAGPQVRRATLHVAVDFARANVWLNGRWVAELENYSPARELDVTAQLVAGRNVLAVEAGETDGPAAVTITLELFSAEGLAAQVVTDDSWLARLDSFPPDWASPQFHPQDWKKAALLGPSALDPYTNTADDVAISPLDDYTQWKQALGTDQGADPSAFLVPTGYEIELLRSAAADEGSWIGLACDPRGRLVIGREDKGLLRVTLPAVSQTGPAARSALKIESIDDTLLECRGLLFAHDSLYVSANTSQGVYRLRDTDGDDRYDEVKKLFDTPGGAGHGRNSLALGPDGKIYAICGDSVNIPTGVGDLTSPFSEHRRQPKSKQGFVLRFDADGGQRELFTVGLRNPYGIAANAAGDFFTYDADAEHDMGSPWYRPTRVNHLVPGADFGWRGVTGSWPPYFPDHPDNGVPNLDIGKGSPTAVAFGTASQFPPAHRDALYALDWAYGRILRVSLTPRGASYAGHAETFIKGRPFNVTSLAFAQDGALYVVTGGRKTQSGLYRIRYVGPELPVPEPTIQQAARAAWSAEDHAVRRRLEHLGDKRVLPQGNLWTYLNSPDPWIRQSARTALEHLPVAAWKDRALAEEQPWGALSGLLALARSGDEKTFDAIVGRLAQLPLDKFSDNQQIAAAYVAWLVLPAEQVSAEARRDALHRLAAIYPARSPLVNKYLSRVLAEQNAPDAAAKTLDLLSGATRQEEKLHYLFVLRTVKEGWTDELRDRYFQALAENRHVQGGEGMPRFLQQIVDNALAAVPDDRREKYAAQLASKEAADDEPLVISRPEVRKWQPQDEAELLAADRRQADLARGKEVFAAALCIRCHRFGSQGRSVGPDLTALARRFSRRDMLESILLPSKVVAEQYRTVRIETVDGRVVSGRIVTEGDYREPVLRIATNPMDPRQVVEVPKVQIETHDTTPVSFMPEGLLNTFSKEEILDLLAYLETAGVTARP